MLNIIENDFDVYKSVYLDILPKFADKEVDKKARVLLENSLYLSVFTTFENFLKELIKNYVENISETGITFFQLTDGFAETYFISQERRISSIFDESDEKRKRAFSSYFKSIKGNLEKKQLNSLIKFEFLHKSKLDGYYKDLFELMLGDRDFLSNVKLTESKADFEGLLDVKGDAFTFLVEYTDKVRNSIAHENEKFQIEGFHSFEKVVDAFLAIISKIIQKYEAHTGFKFELKADNLLDEFI